MTTNSHPHTHPHPHADVHEKNFMVRIQRLAMFLEAHFGEVELHFPEEEQEGEGEEPSLLIRLDEADAQVNLATLVRCARLSQEPLR